MALYTKQEFSPPILSRRWLAIKFRPNMLVYSRRHVVSILESGLLFREDSIELEQEAPSPEEVWAAAGGTRGGWLTKGEAVASLVAVAICVATFPPKSIHRSALLNLSVYASVPLCVVAVRTRGSGTLASLLDLMKRYLARARRAQACIKESMALHNTIASITSVIESTHTLLCRQQSQLAVLMSRASSALLGNVPWLRGDVAWDAVTGEKQDNLMKIHHAFLVVQSTLLKHIAMAHFVPPPQVRRMYKNHNERLYWIHNVLLEHLIEEFRQNLEVLERMYRLLRNIGNNEGTANKKPGSALLDSWTYSDIHNGIARSCIELKLATNKCTDLDIFLDSCAVNQQEVDLGVLSKDVDEIIEAITKCLSTMQNSQIRLSKIKGKIDNDERQPIVEETSHSDDNNIIKIDHRDVEAKDEVFYFVKTEEDDTSQPVADVTTAPGKRERENTKIVLCELKRKLGKREDVMRERERQALRKTMPELRDQVPEFPRQIQYEEFVELKGYINKLKRISRKKKLFRHYKITNAKNGQKFRLQTEKYVNESDITQPFYEANAKLNFKSRFVSVLKSNKTTLLTRWIKKSLTDKNKSNLLEEFSDAEAYIPNNAVRVPNGDRDVENRIGFEAKNFSFTKRDLELSNSSSESDIEAYKEKKMALLKDARRHRAARKKNYPSKRPSIDKVEVEDEGLRPIEYSFGTGLAMASVLQINNNVKMPHMVQEDVFIGDGEVSNDSGNDEDA